MQTFSFSLEKVKRFYNVETIPSTYTCFAIQIAFLKKELLSGYYFYQVSNENGVNYENEMYIDTLSKEIKTIGDHEDPLIETDTHFLVCIHIDIKEVELLSSPISLKFKKDNEVLKEIKNVDYFSNYLKSAIKDYSVLSDNEIYTNIDCTLRIHKGEYAGKYSEDEFPLTSSRGFNFKKYLDNYAYVGIQCSYNINGLEIEEKYIPIGQKNMGLSCDYYDGEILHKSLLPNMTNYQTLVCQTLPEIYKNYNNVRCENWKILNNISEVLDNIKIEAPVFFEIDINFIIDQYRQYNTYGINKVINKTVLKNITHLDSAVCKQCKMNYKCLQLIPSGLSYSLFKETLSYEKPEDCRIFKEIDKL